MRRWTNHFRVFSIENLHIADMGVVPVLPNGHDPGCCLCDRGHRCGCFQIREYRMDEKMIHSLPLRDAICEIGPSATIAGSLIDDKLRSMLVHHIRELKSSRMERSRIMYSSWYHTYPRHSLQGFQCLSILSHVPFLSGGPEALGETGANYPLPLLMLPTQPPILTTDPNCRLPNTSKGVG